MFKKRKPLPLDAPLLHRDHKRPVSRREFLAQGLLAGAGSVLAPSLLSLAAAPRSVHAALADDILALQSSWECAATTGALRKIPFICIDLAGGANISGSNVLVGKQGGQLDFLSTAGYSKQGLPGDMIPPLVNPNTNTNDFINTDYGLAFHSDSAFLRGIQERAPTRGGNTSGAVIPARSDNDTGNNPHNPMYGIYRAGARGGLSDLIGSRSSDSGGNSMAPAALIDLEVRPTKVDRPTDVTGMVDTGDLISLLSQDEAVRVMETMVRVTDRKFNYVGTGLANDDAIKKLVKCGYLKSASLVDKYADPSALNPLVDEMIVGGGGFTPIFSGTEILTDREFGKTASVMKMVIDNAEPNLSALSLAGAGTISMGGFDYHTGERSTGEQRDLRAGRCIGACLEYAARKGVPLMIYVCSDGSVASNGTVLSAAMDPLSGGKPVWTGDNSSTAASFFLVYNPGGRPVLRGATPDEQAQHQQIGWFRSDGSVETASRPPASNVNLLVETVILNYMALHQQEGLFDTAPYFPNHGLGSVASRDALIAFEGIVSGAIT